MTAKKCFVILYGRITELHLSILKPLFMKKNILVAGLAAVLVLAASAQVIQKNAPPKPPAAPKATIEKNGDIPPPPPPPPPMAPPAPPAPPEPGDQVAEKWNSNDYDAFLERNPSVKGLSWNNKNWLTIRLKSGKEEKYNLADEKSKKAAEDKYGELPVAPPPPPLPPPPPPPPAPSKIGTVTLS